MAKIIEVKDLVKRYKKAKENAVDRISFSVKKGEFFALLGPNGAGKTTTVSILTTTLEKTSGKVFISGYDLDKNPGKIRENVGVIFQNPSLDLNLTAEENIRFHAILYGLYPYKPLYSMMPASYKKRVKSLADVLEIEKQLFDPVKSFSGGMRRKLEIIRSLMHNPKVLYLDEPTSGLDPASRIRLWEYLEEVREKERTTMFLTTHYLEEAEDADKIAIINNGKIVSLGTPKKIKKDLIDEYLIIDAADKIKLKRELDRLDISYKENRKIRIDIEKANAQKIIASIKTPLTFIDIEKPTLEEAYLEIIQKENGEEK